MKVTFSAIWFPSITQMLSKIRSQKLKGDISYALARIAKAIEPEWQAFKSQRDPLLLQYKDDQVGLKTAYFEVFGGVDIEVCVQPIKVEWLQEMMFEDNEMDLMSLFIQDEGEIQVVKSDV